jgi:hypothetical protein
MQFARSWVATDLWVRNTEGMKKEFRGDDRAEARKVAAKNSLGRMGKPEGARKSHGFPVFRAGKLHHRRVAQPRRRAPERPLVTSSTQLAQRF